jgi:cation diffusion facilitator CzcD-associated flavoprotein CzcO
LRYLSHWRKHFPSHPQPNLAPSKHCVSLTSISNQAGSDLGGIWYWNRYPGARVDSQYPVYALSIPEVYKDWTWSSHYPDHAELRAYFQHVEDCLHVKKDCVFDSKVTSAVWDDTTCLWTITCETGRVFTTRYWTACTGFAAKRYFPDWEGLDDFKGVIHHSSFWPKEGVDVKGKRVAVVGTGATGVQITQEVSEPASERVASLHAGNFYLAWVAPLNPS